MSFTARNGPTLLVLALALAVAGAIAALSLPVGLFPQVAFPRVVVDLDAGSRSAEQTALLLTAPVEQAVRTVPGVQSVRSQSTRGSAQISVDFGWGRDMIAATLLVQAAIAQVVPTLPAGTGYRVRRMDPTVYPIMSFALVPSAGPRGQTPLAADPVALRDLATLQIVPLLSSIAGLARVSVEGGDTAEIEVQTDAHRLATYGLTLADLARTIGDNSVLQAVGQLQDRDKLFLAIADSSPTDAATIGALVVRAGSTGLVRVRDVASVAEGVVPQWVRVTEDTHAAVLLDIYEQPDGNAVSIAAAVRGRLSRFGLPAGVRLVTWYDQSQLVNRSAASVRDAVLIGLVLAALVLMGFLRSWRMTLIACIAVVGTLAVTIIPLELLGMSFNIMTLGGIAAAVGLLIDDVIVMIEHIAREARSREDVLPAAHRFLRPLAGSSLATLIVFVPLGFLSGVTGAFSMALSVTMGSALIVSYAMTALVVPLLARSLVDFTRWHDPGTTGRGWLDRTHGWLLTRLFAQPWLLLPALAVLLAAGWIAYHRVPTGFMPKVDEGGFVMDYYSAPGTSLTETDREMAQVDAMLLAMPELDTFSRRLGTGLGGDLNQSYHGDYFVRLKDSHARSTPVIMADLLAKVKSQVPGIQVDAAQRMEDLIGDLAGAPQPIEVKLFGESTRQLIPVAKAVAAAIGKLAGVVEVHDGVQLAGDALDIRLDPVKVGLEGMTPIMVTQQANDALTGSIATFLVLPTKSVGVRVRIAGAQRLREDSLAALAIRAPDGHIFPLSRVATIAPVIGQPQISRENLQPMIAITGRIQNRGIGAAIADIQNVLAKPGLLPAAMRYTLGGVYQQQQIAFAGLLRVFCAALLAELLLLMFLYGGFLIPLIIMACSILSTVAVFVALWLTGVELNITALMGTTMVVGISTEMAIFYVSEYAALSGMMQPREALRLSSRTRLRPITMTTLAAVLTLLPLSLAIGSGSAVQQPLAIAIIAGLLLQYPLVLLALPVMIGLTLPQPADPA
ncbi:efflux RND transporter permease subunit [Lichenicola cladoniae]|uniref:Efflux RND transporter permease subunit n=1 Tax=Lichenicola cladoniae TaxID=1484109 RepID=A0A6M8H5B7_9PROT|nr:efflux RND transporter permease subunit [Lichenicola cladoniae]NPD65181.1 efflux RND transporter permease subunit [Acetobacteraceae bacterium]QKE88781.1 efflux RND transporter permease subunit [Lichenicola cladoniae]